METTWIETVAPVFVVMLVAGFFACLAAHEAGKNSWKVGNSEPVVFGECGHMGHRPDQVYCHWHVSVYPTKDTDGSDEWFVYRADAEQFLKRLEARHLKG